MINYIWAFFIIIGTIISIIKDNTEVTNIDIIKRLSQLEKMVYGSKDSKKDEE